ncbi:YafY family transcriptional regulator [Sediminibacterium roseum]|uniref:YafY family transcriptional regulator n=1 Tax=Sediminibacterium roseum TaxID=1978412 RepID=A0ABW9ZR33_9BACT|nr:YafY family protein [Sediminibacterium roseum]NCI48922.1 YafY family transcriptional regulator [Sediminibacterium roseum]
MNRIDRVTAILIQLQSRRVVKAQDMADRFNISLRTVYRDIKTIEEAGVPVIGEAGVGYSIMEGFRLPPVMFTRDEATALLTAEKLVEKLTDHSTQAMYQAAMFKIRSVLRLTERDHLENMEQHIEVVESPYFSRHKNETAYLQQILKAIAESSVVNIDYFAEHSQSKSNRNIEPVGIFFMGRYWYLIAWCTLRKDYRTFRVDHIKYLSITAIRFNKTHPALKSFLSRVSKEKELHTIIILVNKEIMRYFGEQKFYNGFVSQREVDDKIEMTFLTESLTGFAKFYLLFGEQAEIVRPLELTDVVRDLVEKLRKKLAPPARS